MRNEFDNTVRCLPNWRSCSLPVAVALMVLTVLPVTALAAEGEQIFVEGRLDAKARLQAGGVVGYAIIFLSMAMVALIVEHLLSIRRGTLIPAQLSTAIEGPIKEGNYQAALERCRESSSFLGFVVSAGLQEASLGYTAVEKAMEDASLEQSARLMRKIDYLSLIGAVAPMLGLLGTVWGMIQAFAEFAEKANPLPGDFAPAISEALVTTLFGLMVAIPAAAAYVWFRNRVDELVAETSLVAVHLMSPLKRALADRRRSGRLKSSEEAGRSAEQPASPRAAPRPAVPPVTIERGQQ